MAAKRRNAKPVKVDLELEAQAARTFTVRYGGTVYGFVLKEATAGLVSDLLDTQAAFASTGAGAENTEANIKATQAMIGAYKALVEAANRDGNDIDPMDVPITVMGAVATDALSGGEQPSGEALTTSAGS